MSVTTSNLSQADFVRLSQYRFLGRTLSDTYGHGTATPDQARGPQRNWTLDQLLLLASVRSNMALA